MTYKNVIFLFFCFGFMVFLALIAQKQNHQKQTLNIEILFEKKPHILNDSIVNKLLTQNQNQSFYKVKDSLVLSEVEVALEQNEVVENAEVFLKPSGVIGVKVTERKPFFLVEDTLKYFVDQKAERFPFYEKYDEILPLFRGPLPEDRMQEVVQFFTQFEQDNFIQSELRALSFNEGNYFITLRSYPFKIIFGDSYRLKEKIKKLKIFCAFQRAQDTLKGYNVINLKYKNQVVAQNNLVL